MFVCRAAWQRCGPLARQSLYRAQLYRDVVPRRLMSSVPGGSGDNFLYAILCGGTFAGALAYAYSTVATDHARFVDRVSEINTRPKSEWKPKPWPLKSGDEGDEESGEEVAGGAEDGEDVEIAESTAKEENVTAEAASEVALGTVESAGALETVVETVAETVVETAEAVAEVAGVVAEAAEEVAAVAEEVKKIAEEIEEAAEAVVAPVIQAEEPASESNGTPPAPQKEAVTEATETEA